MMLFMGTRGPRTDFTWVVLRHVVYLGMRCMGRALESLLTSMDSSAPLTCVFWLDLSSEFRIPFYTGHV